MPAAGRAASGTRTRSCKLRCALRCSAGGPGNPPAPGPRCHAAVLPPRCSGRTTSPRSGRRTVPRARPCGRSERCMSGRAAPASKLVVEASAFLKHMVRNIVGTLVEVGSRPPRARLAGRAARGARSDPGRSPRPRRTALVLDEVFYLPGNVNPLPRDVNDQGTVGRGHGRPLASRLATVLFRLVNAPSAVFVLLLIWSVGLVAGLVALVADVSPGTGAAGGLVAALLVRRGPCADHRCGAAGARRDASRTSRSALDSAARAGRRARALRAVRLVGRPRRPVPRSPAQA